MTEGQKELPLHLQRQEAKLAEALQNLRTAYDIAIGAEEQLKVTLQGAKHLLDENNYFERSPLAGENNY